MYNFLIPPLLSSRFFDPLCPNGDKTLGVVTFSRTNDKLIFVSF
jgi:hypothetical protein